MSTPTSDDADLTHPSVFPHILHEVLHRAVDREYQEKDSDDDKEEEEEEAPHPPGCMCGVKERKEFEPDKMTVFEPSAFTDAVLLFPFKGNVSMHVHSQVLSIHSTWFAEVFQLLASAQPEEDRKSKKKLEYSFADVDGPLQDIPWVIICDVLYKMYQFEWKDHVAAEKRYTYRNWASMYKLMHYWGLSPSILNSIIPEWQENMESVTWTNRQKLEWTKDNIPSMVKIMFGPSSQTNVLRPFFVHGIDTLSMDLKRARKLYNEFKALTWYNKVIDISLDHIPALCLQKFLFQKLIDRAVDPGNYHHTNDVFDPTVFISVCRFFFFHKEYCQECNPDLQGLKRLRSLKRKTSMGPMDRNNELVGMITESAKEMGNSLIEKVEPLD